MVTMGGSSCTRKVLDKLVKTCDLLTDQTKSEITIEYIKCRVGTIDITLPNDCRSRGWFWKTCDKKLILDKNPNLWTTYESFYRNIETVCFAHTYQKHQERRQQYLRKLHQIAWDNSNGIRDLMRDFITTREEHAAYFKSIDNGIHDANTAVMKMGDNVNAIHDISKVTADKLNSVSDNVVKLSSDMSHIEKTSEKAMTILNCIVRKLYELEKPVEKAFDIINESRPFLTFANEAFGIVWHLWGTLSSLWHSCFFMFRNIYYGDIIAPLILLFLFSVWFFCLRGPIAKLIPIVILGILERSSLNGLERTSPYIIIAACFIFLLMFIFFYRLLSVIYVHRCCVSARAILEKMYEEPVEL
jgi:ACT domain-containing protein